MRQGCQKTFDFLTKKSFGDFFKKASESIIWEKIKKGGAAALKRRQPPFLGLLRKWWIQKPFWKNHQKITNDQKIAKKVIIIDFFCNFDLKVVHIHPFWLIFCLQALFDLPDSILIVSRPKKAKKDKKRPKTQNYIKKYFWPPPAVLGFVTLGGVVFLSLSITELYTSWYQAISVPNRLQTPNRLCENKV